MSDTDTGSPDTTNTPVETISSDVPNQIPTPDAPPQTAPDPAVQAANAPAPPAAPKPSVWKGVLMGALQGLAAGGSVDTHGLGAGAGFAKGAAAGANQVLNVAPQQKAELDQTKASTALHYANLAKIQQDMNLMPDSRREQHLDDAVDHTEQLFKSGAIVPMSEVSKDPVDAQKQLMQLHAQNPWAVYSIAPVRDEKGDVAYQTVQFGKAPLQKDLVLPGMGADGKDLTIPAGTPGETVGKLYTAAFTKQMDAAAKKALEKQKEGGRSVLEDKKQTGRMAVQSLRNQGAAARAAAGAGDKASQFLDKNYVKPANDVEQSYQMMNQAYKEYMDAKAKGQELPTGAQSMLALSMHLSTTFGNVKGSRVTKDMIQEHLGARGVSDAAQVAVQRLTNGDQLSPAQWEAFRGLIKFSRTSKWQIAQKEAKAKGVDISGSVPSDVPGGKGQVASTIGAPPTSSPTPQTHVFNSAAWATANPKGDVNAAKAAAAKQGYQVQ